MLSSPRCTSSAQTPPTPSLSFEDWLELSNWVNGSVTNVCVCVCVYVCRHRDDRSFICVRVCFFTQTWVCFPQRRWSRPIQSTWWRSGLSSPSPPMRTGIRPAPRKCGAVRAPAPKPPSPNTPSIRPPPSKSPCGSVPLCLSLQRL